MRLPFDGAAARTRHRRRGITREAPREGFEPSTSGLEGQRSFQLSYRGRLGLDYPVNEAPLGRNTGRNKIRLLGPPPSSSVNSRK